VIVVYDGLGTDPLALNLPRVPWTTPSSEMRASEVDVVGSPWQQPATAGRLIGHRVVGGYLVDRFALTPAWTGSPSEIASRATTRLLGQAPPDPAPPVLVQRAQP
jgi:hypothetical protein